MESPEEQPVSDQASSNEADNQPVKANAQTIWDAWRIGVLGFGLASLAVFGSWAFMGGWFYSNLGEAGAYIAWLVLYLGIGCEVMKGLTPGPGARLRFFKIFSVSFAAYAVLWIVVWMATKNRTGEALAAVFGSLAMGLCICAFLGNMREWHRVWVVLTISNASGYFIGSWLHATMGMPWGAVAWGVAYGFFFGGGIGPAFWFARTGGRIPSAQ